MEQGIERAVRTLFSKSGKRDWERIAMQETQEKDPLQTLSWKGNDDILFRPYYDEEDGSRLEFLTGIQNPAPEVELQSHNWISVPSVISADAASANRLALEHLAAGADGVLFDLSRIACPDLNQLLQEIELPACFTAFHVGDASGFATAFSQYLRQQGDPASVRGALFCDPITGDGDWDFLLRECVALHSLGIVVPPAAPAQEIAFALLKGVKCIESFAHTNTASVFRAIAFSLTADPSLCESIAKYRALRMLWYQVAQAYGHVDYNLRALHIHARSFSPEQEVYAPHENMLKGTFSAMAAIMGGCDSLTIEAAEEPQLRRWARNVSNVMREESFLGAACDPAAGAYALECMTQSIAQKAWSMFQEKVVAL